jgi:hypothetical protein
MSPVPDQVIAHINTAETTPPLGPASEELVARWTENDDGKLIKRQKKREKGPERTTERTDKRDGIWILQESKWEGGRWIADDKVVIPLQYSKLSFQHSPKHVSS